MKVEHLRLTSLWAGVMARSTQGANTDVSMAELIVGIVGVGVGVFGVWDARRQRSKAERIAEILSTALAEARGHLIRSKSTAPAPEHPSINDCLARIDKAVRDANALRVTKHGSDQSTGRE